MKIFRWFSFFIAINLKYLLIKLSCCFKFASYQPCVKYCFEFTTILCPTLTDFTRWFTFSRTWYFSFYFLSKCFLIKMRFGCLFDFYRKIRKKIDKNRSIRAEYCGMKIVHFEWTISRTVCDGGFLTKSKIISCFMFHGRWKYVRWIEHLNTLW